MYFSKTCEMMRSTSINSKICKVILKDRECINFEEVTKIL